MKLTRRDTLATGAGLRGASLLPRFALAADYPERPIEATELWTFRRDRGGSWKLSAIQQTA